ncbi:MAG: 4Fe-4S dicluster domain-containing protein [Desulfomicrobium sp.]|jgi:molybdopterin-containing oxidoreductase family iron-sulfur binding subunit|nr:4Fe-4S dicluster domain-containing protein [Desulfomicrobium sp.]NLV95922.1 4Fe-4S dicluster domain-containing protein [Desulfovibrionales bacterium]
MKTVRRDFLKVAAVTAFGWGICPTVKALASGGARPSEGLFFASRHAVHVGPNALKAQRWAMVIDTTKLNEKVVQDIVQVCHTTHNVPDISGQQNIKWIWEAPMENLFLDDLHEFQPESGAKTALALCNHCDNPPCVRVCPTKATFQREDGIVIMDFHRCIGCRYCMAGCPYGSRSFNFQDPRPFIAKTTPDFPTRTKGVVEKCEFCAERLAEGKMPACVEVSEGALAFGDLADPESEVRKLLAERFSIRRSPTLGTNPCVYYLV